jgi:hypothetical protein
MCYGVPVLTANPKLEPSLSLVKQPKVAFVKGGEVKGCPGPAKECLGKSFVVENDPVIVVDEAGDYVCAAFTSSGPKSAASTGWLPRAALAAAPAPAATASKPADWIGKWSSGPEHDITIKAGKDGQIAIEGNATWGMMDPERVKRGGVNVGEIAGTLAVKGPTLAFTMGEDDDTLPFDPEAENYSCGVKMWRLGPYLVASDNGMCGGNNVTFAGVYRK